MTVPFWRMRDRYYGILGNKCDDCAQEYFPPVSVCRKCRSVKLKDKAMPRTGTLLSYTMQRESLPGFEDQEPMVFGLVKLVNGVKIIAQLVDMPYESLVDGLRLRTVFRRIRSDGESGQIFYGFKFAPARKGKNFETDD
ncbi:MAG: Zn-ribbon domain-containing OB-fold protein [Nitrososphaerales archaeon]